MLQNLKRFSRCVAPEITQVVAGDRKRSDQHGTEKGQWTGFIARIWRKYGDFSSKHSVKNGPSLFWNRNSSSCWIFFTNTTESKGKCNHCSKNKTEEEIWGKCKKSWMIRSMFRFLEELKKTHSWNEQNRNSIPIVSWGLVNGTKPWIHSGKS